MKGLKVLALIAVLVCAVPLFGAVDAFLKIEGFDSGQTYPGHETWIHLDSWSWGAPTQRAAVNGPVAACATNEAKFSVNVPPLTQANPLPSPLQLGLLGICIDHKQYPTVKVDLNGHQHVLQNASITACQDSPGSTTFTLNFTRCLTHSGGAAMAAMVNPNVHPEGNVKILVGLTPRPESFNFASFQFQGPTAAVFKQRDAGAAGFFQQAFQSKQKFPSLTVERKAGKGSPEYFTVKMSDVLVSSYQVNGDGSVTVGLKFSKADGSVRGFQEVN